MPKPNDIKKSALKVIKETPLKKVINNVSKDVIKKKHVGGLGHGLSMSQDDPRDTDDDSEIIAESEEEDNFEEGNKGDTEDENMDEVDDEDKLDNNDEVEIDSEEGDDKESESDNDKTDDGDDKDLAEGDDCMYRFTKKKSKKLNDDDDDGIELEDDFFEDDIQISHTTKNQKDIYVTPDKRITKPILTKFERVRILGERARQLSLGAKPMINGVSKMDPKDIARMELNLKVMPIIIDRLLPNGQRERWKVNELKIVN